MIESKLKTETHRNTEIGWWPYQFDFLVFLYKKGKKTLREKFLALKFHCWTKCNRKKDKYIQYERNRTNEKTNNNKIKSSSDQFNEMKTEVLRISFHLWYALSLEEFQLISVTCVYYIHTYVYIYIYVFDDLSFTCSGFRHLFTIFLFLFTVPHQSNGIIHSMSFSHSYFCFLSFSLAALSR